MKKHRYIVLTLVAILFLAMLLGCESTTRSSGMNCQAPERQVCITDAPSGVITCWCEK